MEHYTNPSLTEQKPDVALIIIISGNDISYKNLENVDAGELARSIVNLGEKCSESRVSDIVVAGNLAKKNLKVGAVIRKVKGALDDLCKSVHFRFMSNSEITRDFLYNEGVCLTEE